MPAAGYSSDYMQAPKVIADDGTLYRIAIRFMDVDRECYIAEHYPVLERCEVISAHRFAWRFVRSLDWNECDATLSALRSSLYVQPC